MFDSFFIEILHASTCLASAKGAAALQAPRAQALLSAIAQPDTVALVARTLVALSARGGSKEGARRAWLCRLSTSCVGFVCASWQKRGNTLLILDMQSNYCSLRTPRAPINLSTLHASLENLHSVPSAMLKVCGRIAALAVDMLCKCYMRRPAHALSACAALLTPGSNQPLPVRIAAVRGERRLPVHVCRLACSAMSCT